MNFETSTNTNSKIKIIDTAMRKNVVLKCNFRELVHIARLRSDKHAQWDIRNLSDKMTDLVKKDLPLFGKLLCGKDTFNKNFLNKL